MKYISKLLFVTGLALALSACSDPEPTEYQLYFLGGQSNMDGYGFNNELPQGAVGRWPDVMVFRGQPAMDNEAHGGVGTWQALQPGFGTGFQTDGNTNVLSDRFGPELLFGQVMAAQAPGTKIAIIKYALGGSGLADGVGYGNWHPDFADGDGINQYDHALTTLRNALAQSDIDGDGVADNLVPAGIVWMQGEADAHHSQAAADEYRFNLERIMKLLRAALGDEEVPVVIGKITESGMADDGKVMDYIETVQQAQQSFVDDDHCAGYVTEIDDYTHSDDAWHYDSDGYIRMGRAFADAMRGLQGTCASPD